MSHQRSERGGRLYGPEDMAHLRLMKQLEGAALHALRHATALHARHMVEDALDHVIEMEDIKLRRVQACLGTGTQSRPLFRYKYQLHTHLQAHITGLLLTFPGTQVT